MVRSSTFSNGSGSDSASRRDRSTTGRESIPLKRWSSVPAISRTVAVIAGCEWPRIELIWPEVKSRSSRPSLVCSTLPAARSTIVGTHAGQ